MTPDLDVPQAWIDELDEVDLERREALVRRGVEARGRLERLYARAKAHSNRAERLKQRALTLFDEAIEHEAAATRIAEALIGGLQNGVLSER